MPLRQRLARIVSVMAALWLAACGRAPQAFPASPLPTPRAAAASAPDTLDLGALSARGDEALAAQVRRVVASMDATGHPPEGVVQGGRRGGRRGEFQNLEGRLPRRPPGYYQESDVWPRGPDGRGALRLVFGRKREVYFSGDHYRSFVRLR
jgi:guanyl-specific ribonuclease Sa